MIANWIVIVGNIGTVWDGTDEQEARGEFDFWCNESDAANGRAAGEPVTLLKDDVVVLEHNADEAAEPDPSCLDLTDSLSFTRRQQELLLIAIERLNAANKQGGREMATDAEIEELGDMIADA